MAKWGHVDVTPLIKMQKALEKMQKSDLEELHKKILKELAGRLLRKVKLRTPVGEYEQKGKKGGTLRRGWTIGEVVKQGSYYEIEIINQVEYAAYVEYGHRKQGGKGWIPGQFFLTISEKEIEQQKYKIIEKRLEEYLKGCFDGI